MTKDEVPESYVDDNGIFYKPFMADPRAMRELTFYRSVRTWGRERGTAAYCSNLFGNPG